MKRLIWILLVGSACAQLYPYVPPAPASGGGGTTTWTYVQKANTSNSCPTTGTTCTITVASTCSGCVSLIAFGANTSLSTPGVYISSVSGAGTWTTFASGAGCNLYNGVLVNNVSCAYNLNETSGVTSITVTFNQAQTGGPGGLFYAEASWTGATPTYDTSGTLHNATAGTSQPGPALTLSGTSDFCVQVQAALPATVISGSYTGLATMGAGGNDSAAYGVNISSGAAPNWTVSSGTDLTGAICIQ